MNFQLLIILAVIASSLLTLSQRANAQEISKQRWINTTQLSCEVTTQDVDVEPVDNNCMALHASFITYNFIADQHYLGYQTPSQDQLFEHIQPRAPPVF